jgi:ABC-type lipoprotein export system ATPase subunit
MWHYILLLFRRQPGKSVLADEPTGNLDPATGMEVLEVLSELQRTGNQTLIMVTHNPQLAALADRRIQLLRAEERE